MMHSCCEKNMKDALLEFKAEFYVKEFSGNTAETKRKPWRNNTDCCAWDGISCDPKTGTVVELDLSFSYLNGPLRFNSSLFRLQHLQSVMLDSNNLTGILPDSIGDLKYLRVLSLSVCNLFGKIPPSVGNLSYLTHLDLSNNDFVGELPDSLGKLNRLKKLKLSLNELRGNFLPKLLNFSELKHIDLGSNQFEGMLPSNMSSFSKLMYFVISRNSFSGSIPSSLFAIPSLISLDMERNNFNGFLEIGNISTPSKLQELSLVGNNFSGPIPKYISKLVSLTYLDLSYSHLGWGGAWLTLSLFSNLFSLYLLDLSGHNLKIVSTLHLPSPIEILMLSSCNIVEFPKFLQTQTKLFYLDISVNQIKGQVPGWLWRLPELSYVVIYHNRFSGFEGPADVIQRSELYMLDISSNTFLDFPLLPKSTNSILGSENRFSREIPKTICELVYLQILVLSNNNFSGSIPLCFVSFRATLLILHLRNNSLSGILPKEVINNHLESLNVGHNRFSGELPKSLINCTQLQFLNVEDNIISDKFPFWLRLLPNLCVLVLRSNEFHGPISSPGVSLSFPALRIFDISDNRFTGVLPSDYFASWDALIEDHMENNFDLYYGSVDLRIKGMVMELFGSSYKIFKTIDVSGNILEGDIPKSIGLLNELVGLNMSNNAFTSQIPSLANLSNLESLDLSKNRLCGQIPPELGKLTFLSHMNFSYNMLEGPIPKGTQIQSQDSSSFAENPWLCGAPLQQSCEEEEEETKEEEDENEEKEEEEHVISWTAAAIAYVPGVLYGLAIGHILSAYKHDWFMKIFHYST